MFSVVVRNRGNMDMNMEINNVTEGQDGCENVNACGGDVKSDPSSLESLFQLLDLNVSTQSHSNAVLLPSQTSQRPRRSLQRLREDALVYLRQIELEFANQPHVCDDFVNIINDFRLKGVDSAVVVERVLHLFKDHPHLVAGTNRFFRPGVK